MKTVTTRRSISLLTLFTTCLLWLYPVPLNAANITLSVQQPGGEDWNSTDWSDGQSATDSAAADPANTYEVLPGARLRTPNNGVDDTFPGALLTIDGSGVWVNNPAAGNTNTSEIRFKQATSDGRVVFPKLVMNGGQLDTGNDGTVTIDGEIDILKNTTFYNDGPNDRGYVVGAWLTGNADIEYRGYVQNGLMPNYIHNLNIAGNSNTFSGRWNVVIGTLLATGTNALGTNNITIGPTGALETTYDINNPHGSLQLNGAMYLHQDDSFRSVTVGTVGLPRGKHTFDELSAAFPTNFPASWTAQFGADAFSTGSGSITVLEDNTTPVTIVAGLTNLTAQPGTTATFVLGVSGPVLGIQWYSNNVAIPGANALSYTTDPLTLANDNSVYKIVVTNAVNSVESSATLHVTSEGINITLATQQPAGASWETAGYWSDGKPASVSAAANAKNTYEVLPGARLRSPDSGTDDTFPGSLLKIDGSGVFVNNPAATDKTTAEIRFKQSTAGGTVTFPHLLMNGGQLDTGNDGIVTISGLVEIATNTPIYNDNVNDRGYVINAVLTGPGTIEYRGYNATAFNPDYVNNLNIAGHSNTFSGQWNIVIGALLGTGTNALGTNNITVGTNGVLETTYDLNSPNAALTVDGMVYLHQNDTFRSLTVAGTALSKGTHTFQELSATYPANFPATWTAQTGAETFSAGSGSITVLGTASPTVVTLNNSRHGTTGFSFDFTTENGVAYVVEYKNSLNDPNWQTLTNIPGTGGAATTSDNSGGTMRFYRIRVQ